MEQHNMDLFHIGQKVIIRRSSGKLQFACIADMNRINNTFRVIWNDERHKKQKRIKFKTIVDLNKEYDGLIVPLPDNDSEDAASTITNIMDYAVDDAIESRELGEFRPYTSLETYQADQECSSSQRAALLKIPFDVGRECRRSILEALMSDHIQPDLTLEDETQCDAVVDDCPIMVCIRKRPLTIYEKRRDLDVVQVRLRRLIYVYELGTKVDLRPFLETHRFYFDYIFDEFCDTRTVYLRTVRPLIKTLFGGGRGTCFAYGQTGAGKTHTVVGDSRNGKLNIDNGFYAMAAKDIFDELETSNISKKGFVVTCSFFEIYARQVFDLLAAKRHTCRVLEDFRHDMQMPELIEVKVNRVLDVLRIIEFGNKIRRPGVTSANSSSSRSHAVFMFILRKDQSPKPYGALTIIDLAGNERGADNMNADPKTRQEAADINTSLLTLKEVILSLTIPKQHVPYRQSALTKILQDSFIGKNSKTCMIAMISPCMSTSKHTLDTLRYADQVKSIGKQRKIRELESKLNNKTIVQKTHLHLKGISQDFDKFMKNFGGKLDNLLQVDGIEGILDIQRCDALFENLIKFIGDSKNRLHRRLRIKD